MPVMEVLCTYCRSWTEGHVLYIPEFSVSALATFVTFVAARQFSGQLTFPDSASDRRATNDKCSLHYILLLFRDI